MISHLLYLSKVVVSVVVKGRPLRAVVHVADTSVSVGCDSLVNRRRYSQELGVFLNLVVEVGLLQLVSRQLGNFGFYVYTIFRSS